MIKAPSIMPVTRRGVKFKKPFKAGDVRSDGKIFWTYCGVREYWVTPKRFQDLREKSRIKASQNYYKHQEKRQQEACAYNQRPKAKRQRKAYLAREDVQKRQRILTRQRLAKLRKESPEYRLACSVRRRMHNALRGMLKADKSMVLLGCSPADLRQSLEARFEPGMTWDNYGTVWHVDHVIPIAAYDLTDPTQQREAFHYTNLQPLWASANMAKSDTVEGEDVVLGMLAA
jgi:hypothetical protein